MEKRKIEWLIHVNAKANSEVSHSFLAEEDALERVVCDDGKRRNFWRVSHQFVLELEKNKEECGFVYELWQRRGGRVAQRVPKFLVTRPAAKVEKPTVISTNKIPPHLRPGDQSPFG